MLPSAKRLGILALLGTGVIVAAVANAQTNTITRTNTNTFGNNANVGVRIGPGVLYNSIGNTMTSNPYNPSLTPNYSCYGYCPYGSYSGSCYGSGYGNGGYGGGYGGGYYSGLYGCTDPYNGYLTGAAAVITAQSQFITARSQARVTDEQAKQAAVDTRARIYAEWKYEKNEQPTLAQIRREAIEQAYKIDVFHADPVAIWSGSALNRIFEHAARIQGQNVAGPTVNLNEDTLKKINFTTGVAGNIVALKNQGKLDWPSLFLTRPEFAKERDQLSTLAADAYRTGRQNNRVDPGVLVDMERNLKSLEEKLRARVQDEDPNDYSTAMRYLTSLNKAMTILKGPNPGKWLDPQFPVSGKTVGELVQNMSNAGLRFGPVRDGEEEFYNALYKALVSYDLGITQKSRSGS
jgi:hypothetical protein